MLTWRQRYLARGQLRDLFLITERKGGAVYRTKFVGTIVMDPDGPMPIDLTRVIAVATS